MYWKNDGGVVGSGMRMCEWCCNVVVILFGLDGCEVYQEGCLCMF